MSYIVKNLPGAHLCTCNCKDFLYHWQNYTGKPSAECSAYNCPGNKNLVGANVTKFNDFNDNIYIVPLCKNCNNPSNNDSFKLKPNATLVPVFLDYRCKPS
jgi:hypothetical protein